MVDVFSKEEYTEQHEVLWGFSGEAVQSKLEPFLSEYGLTYQRRSRKGAYCYRGYLSDFEGYEALEQLASRLDLDLRIHQGAEWLAVLASNYKGWLKERLK